MATILIVDDEKNIRSGLAIAAEEEDYDTYMAENGKEAWDIINKKHIDLVITDLRMPIVDGSELLKRTVASYPTMPVIVLTGHGSIEHAVKAMHDGAIDFFTKPVDLDHLFLTIKKALGNKAILEQNKVLVQEIESLKKKNEVKQIIGKSEKVAKLMQTIEQVASSRASVLITGESGVGKELVASALHSLSSRDKKPYIKVHCASLSQSLLESELFGHEKGAFTGAISQKKGRFELADGGTIFLDEIGEIDLQTQVKILRVLQEKTFERVGGEKTIKVDVRIVAATNRDLRKEIEKGAFREDLFYRLNVVNIFVPPLRERKEDIAILTNSFIKEFNKDNGKNVEGISPAVKKVLFSHSWPGNIRELRNTIESGIVMAKGHIIELDDLPDNVKINKEKEMSIEVGISLADAEKEIIIATIAYAGGNKSKAAEILQIGRKTLHRKLLSYDLEGLDEG